MRWLQDETEAEAFAYLHGLWVDRERGSTVCVDARTSPPRVPYCSGGDSELSGVFENWRFVGGQFVARFRWLNRAIAGHIVLRPDGANHLVGGWWYDKDVPDGQIGRLPFLPGIHPCLWVRQSDDRAWPSWGAAHLGLDPDVPVTTRRYPGPLMRRGSLETAVSERGAAGRYRQRIVRWTEQRSGLERLTAKVRHHVWWLAHNLVAHPLLAVAASRPVINLHDWTSQRLNREREAPEPSPAPEIGHRLWWVVHNLVAHPAIALVPCATTFKWHDVSARRMRVPGWI